jgi:hypothetical protein
LVKEAVREGLDFVDSLPQKSSALANTLTNFANGSLGESFGIVGV